MDMKFFDFNDKPAFSLRPNSTPLVLQFNESRQKAWVPNYDADFGSQAVPISEERFKEMAGDMANQMPTKV